MKSVYDTIVKVRATSSKNDKLAILTKQKDNKDLREFLRVTYEPRINFYISKVDGDICPFDVPREFSIKLVHEIVQALNGRDVTGNEAKRYLSRVFNSFKNEWECELLTMLIERDVKAGFSESTINKVWADTVTDVPYMRCSLPKDAKLDKFPWSRGVFSQIKADGMFANITHDDYGNIRIESRNGSPFPLDELDNLVQAARTHVKAGMQLHGELLVARKRTSGLEILPRQEGNGMLNKVLKGGELPKDCVVLYDAWDVIPADKAVTKGKVATKYEVRFKELTYMLQHAFGAGIRIIETEIVHSFKEAQAHYQQALARGLEGTIIKHPDMEWKDGTSKEQVKMKLEFEVELRVVGFNEGKNKYTGMLGSLQCVSEDGKLKVNVAGFTDAQRKEIWNSQDEWMDSIVTVKSNSIMPPENKEHYSLFLPIFVEERQDKKRADTLDRIVEQFEAATA